MTTPTRRPLRLWPLALCLLLPTLNLTLSLAQGGAPLLSPDARVSLITVGPGAELYSAYGHSALRVNDPQLGIDYVFNYGTFDFQTEGFYFKFARGRLDYMLSVHGYDLLLEGAAADRRAVTEQVLALDRAQTARLFELLQINYRPENRFYRYDFFYDNCATRLRDVLERACGERLQWPAALGEAGGAPQSFRSLIDAYHSPVVDLGIDIGLGRPADRLASARDRAFLPNELMALAEGARLGGAPLVRQQARVLPMAAPAPRPWWQRQAPALVALVLTLALVLWVAARAWAIRRGRAVASWRLPLLVQLLLGLVGVVGLVLAFLTFFADHSATAANLNLLWAWPTHLGLLWAMASARRRAHPGWQRALRAYGLATAVASLAVVVVDVAGVQDMHPAAVQLAIGLGCLLLHLGAFGPGERAARVAA